MINTLLTKNGRLLKRGTARIGFEAGGGGGVPTDYIAYWKLDGDFTDETGNYPMTAYNSPTFTTGRTGQALSLNGSNQYAAASGLTSNLFCDGSLDYTVGLWFNTSDTARAFMFAAADGGGDPMGFGLEGSGQGVIYFQRGAGGGTGATNTWGDNNWHFGVARNNTTGNEMDIWIDGVQVSTYTSTATSTGKNQPATIGRYGTYNGMYWNGLMEKVRVYDRALTDAEIIALYNE